MRYRTVIVENGLRVTRYEKPADVSRAYGMLLQTVLNRLNSHIVGSDGLFMYYESEGRPTPVIPGRRRPVVAISSTGVKVYFRTLLDAGRFFEKGNGSIYYALNGSKKCRHWTLTDAAAADGCIEYQPGMTCHMFVSDQLSAGELKQAGIQLSAEDICKQIGAKRSAGGRRKDGRYRPHTVRQDVVYGYYDNEFGPVICPVCGMCVPAADTRGADHLKKCLPGHAWRMRFDGVIEVKDGDEAVPLLGEGVFSGRKRGKGANMD